MENQVVAHHYEISSNIAILIFAILTTGDNLMEIEGRGSPPAFYFVLIIGKSLGTACYGQVVSGLSQILSMGIHAV